MFGVFIYDLIFFSVPAALLVLLGAVIYRYVSAKKKNKAHPGTFSEIEIRKRKNALIITSIVVGILVTIVVGFSALMFMAVAYM